MVTIPYPAKCSGHDIGRMHDLNAGVAGKSALVEGKNTGEAMYLYGSDQSRVMCRLSDNLILNDQALPNRIDRRCIGQQSKHALQAHEFGGRLRVRRSVLVSMSKRVS